MREDKPGGKKARPEETDKRILAQREMRSRPPRPGEPEGETKPEDGIVEMDGGFMLTTSEILDFAEGTDSLV
jgi:hypothetical protein